MSEGVVIVGGGQVAAVAGDVAVAVVVHDLDLALDDVGDLVVRALEAAMLGVAPPQPEAEPVVDGRRADAFLPRRVRVSGRRHRFFPDDLIGFDDADPGIAQIAHVPS